MKKELVQQYAAGAERLSQAIAGLSQDELLAYPVPGTWSIQQIVLHLMDSDLISSDRMKRVIAEENPTLIGFDETAFTRGLFYEALDAALAADVFA
ncbi:MAG TPA: DinB family protein, partial [Pirellulales bacterium]